MRHRLRYRCHIRGASDIGRVERVAASTTVSQAWRRHVFSHTCNTVNTKIKMPSYNADAVDFFKKRNAIAMNYCSSLRLLQIYSWRKITLVCLLGTPEMKLRCNRVGCTRKGIGSSHRAPNRALNVFADDVFRISPGNLFLYGTMQMLKACCQRWV